MVMFSNVYLCPNGCGQNNNWILVKPNPAMNTKDPWPSLVFQNTMELKIPLNFLIPIEFNQGPRFEMFIFSHSGKCNTSPNLYLSTGKMGLVQKLVRPVISNNKTEI